MAVFNGLEILNETERDLHPILRRRAGEFRGSLLDDQDGQGLAGIRTFQASWDILITR